MDRERLWTENKRRSSPGIGGSRSLRQEEKTEKNKRARDTRTEERVKRCCRGSDRGGGGGGAGTGSPDRRLKKRKRARLMRSKSRERARGRKKGRKRRPQSLNTAALRLCHQIAVFVSLRHQTTHASHALHPAPWKQEQ